MNNSTKDRLCPTRGIHDFVLLHEAARHAAHCFETLGVSLETFDALQQQALEVPSMETQQDESNIRASKQIQMHMGAQLRMTRNLLARSQSNKDRLQNEIALVRRRPPLPQS